MKYNVGDSVDSKFILQAGNVLKKYDGTPYLSCTLVSGSDSYGAVCWTFPAQMPEDMLGNFVHVRGTCSEYQGKTQIKISFIELTSVTNEELVELVPTCPIDSVKEMDNIHNLVDTMADNDYRAVAKAVLERYGDLLSVIPAAKKVHQSALYGLLMHTSWMMKCADALSQIHSDIIDRDLLLCGTLCHDIGKIREFSLSKCGLVTDYSAEGQLLGHSYLGIEMVAAICNDHNTPTKKALLLKHLIASHSGVRDYGAVEVPKVPEAELLNLIDLIDSRMEIYRENYPALEEGSNAFVPLGHYIYKMRKEVI